jgi:hypothetical protein
MVIEGVALLVGSVERGAWLVGSVEKGAWLSGVVKSIEDQQSISMPQASVLDHVTDAVTVASPSHSDVVTVGHMVNEPESERSRDVPGQSSGSNAGSQVTGTQMVVVRVVTCNGLDCVGVSNTDAGMHSEYP